MALLVRSLLIALKWQIFRVRLYIPDVYEPYSMERLSCEGKSIVCYCIGFILIKTDAISFQKATLSGNN